MGLNDQGRIFGCAAAALFMTATAVFAQQAQFAIPAGPLGASLAAFGRQADLQVTYLGAVASGRTAPAVSGLLSADQALAIILDGSGLTYSRLNANTIRIEAPAPLSGAGDTLLAPIVVAGLLTEGSGSYASGGASVANGLDLTVRETPQSVTVITDQSMRDRNINTVRDAVEQTVGITANRQGVGTDLDSVMWSRGFTVDNYQVDGVPTGLSTTATVAQNTAMYDHVEIVRGAAGLMSGSGSPSATVNLVRKRPTAERQLNFAAEIGSWNQRGATADWSGPLNGDASLRGRIVVDTAGSESYIDRFETEDELVYGILEYDIAPNTMLTIGGSHQVNKNDGSLRTGHPLNFGNGNPTDFGRGFNPAPDWAFYDNQSDNLFAQVTHDFGSGWEGSVEVSHTRYSYDAFAYYLSADAIDEATGAGGVFSTTRWKSDDVQNALNAKVSGQVTAFERAHDLAFGISLSQIDNDTPDYGGWQSGGAIPDIRDFDGTGIAVPVFTESSRADTTEKQNSAWVSSRINVSDSTKVFAGARVTDWSRVEKNTPVGGATTRTELRETGVVVPYIGVVHDLNDRWSLYASHTEVFKPQPSYIRDFDGNTLPPETGTSTEIGAKTDLTPDLTASFALFRTKQDPYAEYDQDTGSYVAREGITTEGAELEVTGEIGPQFQITGGYAFTSTKDKAGNDAVLQIPRHSVKVFGTYHLAGAWEDLTLGGGVTWQSEIRSDASMPAQGSYALVSALARYELTDVIDATLRVNNLLDEEYYTGISTYGVWGAPRNVSLTLNARF